jgi:hypothetical protein
MVRPRKMVIRAHVNKAANHTKYESNYVLINYYMRGSDDIGYGYLLSDVY